MRSRGKNRATAEEACFYGTFNFKRVKNEEALPFLVCLDGEYLSWSASFTI